MMSPTALPGVLVRTKNTFLDFSQETSGPDCKFKGSARIRSLSERTADRSPCGSIISISTAASTPVKAYQNQGFNLTPSTLSEEELSDRHPSLSSTEHSAQGCWENEQLHFNYDNGYHHSDQSYHHIDEQSYYCGQEQAPYPMQLVEQMPSWGGASPMEARAAMTPCNNYVAPQAPQAPKTPQVTTLMVRHIPCRFTQEEVMRHLDSLGYAQKYDFFYLPQDIRSRSNLGYAFVNFVDAATAKSCQDAISGHAFGGCRSRKVCVVVPAHIQGLNSLMTHFRSTAVMRSGHGPVFLNSALPVPQMELLQPLPQEDQQIQQHHQPHRQGQRKQYKDNGDSWQQNDGYQQQQSEHRPHGSRNGGYGGRHQRNYHNRQQQRQY
jgi:hypothetical protein